MSARKSPRPLHAGKRWGINAKWTGEQAPPPLPHPQFAMVVLHLRTVPPSAARCFASADFASLCVLEASAASRPPMKAELPCLLGLLRPASATGGGLRAPPPVSAKILRIFERGNCKEAIFALENGIFRRSALHAHASPQFSMVVPLRSQARLRHSLLHWAYFGLFRALRAAFVRPRRTRRRGRLNCEASVPQFACFRHWRRRSSVPLALS